MERPFPEKSGIFPIDEIDWANPTIERAGIIPVYSRENVLFLGLGINNFSSSLATIGGAYEYKDHDLLETAVREFNEEVGNNIEPIDDYSLMDCTAVQSIYSVSVFLPVADQDFLPLLHFTPTEELHDIIWVTIQQLQFMIDHQHLDFYRELKRPPHKFSMKYPGGEWVKEEGNCRIFHFGHDLRLLAPIIVENSHKILKERKFVVPKTRPLKIKLANQEGELTHDPEDFKRDVNSRIGWDTSYLIVVDDHLVIKSGKGRLYIFPLHQLTEIVGIFMVIKGTLNLTVHALPEYVHKYLQEELLPQSIHSLDHKMSIVQKTGRKSLGLVEEWKKVRSKGMLIPRAVEKMNIVIKYEELTYKLIRDRKVYFNVTRVNFLKGFMRINCKYYGLPPKVYKETFPSLEDIEMIVSRYKLLPEKNSGRKLLKRS